MAVDQADFDHQLQRHLEYVDKVEETKERLAKYLESRRNDATSLAAPSIVHLFDRSSVGQALIDNASVITEDEAVSVRSGPPAVQQRPPTGLTCAAVNNGASIHASVHSGASFGAGALHNDIGGPNPRHQRSAYNDLLAG